jgi:hypothetical protein
MENGLSKTGIFVGFSLCIIYFAGRISEATMGRAARALFRVLKVLSNGTGGGV